jgi:hypothetical protein
MALMSPWLGIRGGREADSNYKAEGVMRDKGGKSAALANPPLDLGSTAV